MAMVVGMEGVGRRKKEVGRGSREKEEGSREGFLFSLFFAGEAPAYQGESGCCCGWGCWVIAGEAPAYQTGDRQIWYAGASPANKNNTTFSAKHNAVGVSLTAMCNSPTVIFVFFICFLYLFSLFVFFICFLCFFSCFVFSCFVFSRLVFSYFFSCLVFSCLVFSYFFLALFLLFFSFFVFSLVIYFPFLSFPLSIFFLSFFLPFPLSFYLSWVWGWGGLRRLYGPVGPGSRCCRCLRYRSRASHLRREVA